MRAGRRDAFSSVGTFNDLNGHGDPFGCAYFLTGCNHMSRSWESCASTAPGDPMLFKHQSYSPPPPSTRPGRTRPSTGLVPVDSRQGGRAVQPHVFTYSQPASQALSQSATQLGKGWTQSGTRLLPRRLPRRQPRWWSSGSRALWTPRGKGRPSGSPPFPFRAVQPPSCRRRLTSRVRARTRRQPGGGIGPRRAA